MSRFTGPLAIREFNVDSDTWELLEDLVWEVGEEGSGQFVVVPTGFISDGASIPWPINIVMHRWGRYRRAACLHDFLCELIRKGTPHRLFKTRKDADREFSIANQASGISVPMRGLLYTGVRIGAIFGIGTPRGK